MGRKPRGRPRSFDIEEALGKAEALFHARGYEDVSVATLSEALGINPPSFYAAFGSKAGLFERVLERYARSALPLDEILRPGRDLCEALTDLLETATRIYGAKPSAPGCLVLEATRITGDSASAAVARRYRDGTRLRVRDFAAASAPQQAERLADFIDLVLSGLSAAARDGWTGKRLAEAAATAALAIPAAVRA